MVKYSRLNFLVPVPEVGDFEELNVLLLQRCRDDLQRRIRRYLGQNCGSSESFHVLLLRHRILCLRSN